MRPYEVQVHGVKVKVTVVPNDASILKQKLSLIELRSKRVVGVDVKFHNKAASLLLLCIEGHCFIIPIHAVTTIEGSYGFYSATPELKRLLSDKNICFVCSKFKSEAELSFYEKLPYLMKQIGIEVDHLAATILKKPSLLKKDLCHLGCEVGIDIKSAATVRNTNWAELKVFSEEEIQYLIYDVYGAFLVGNKLLGSL